jgi:tetratricopeptide (TPR) repeat protein
LKGIEYFTLGKFSEAIATFSRAAFLDPNDSSIYYHRAEACLEILDFDTAIRNYRKCLLLQKNQSNFVMNRLAFVLYTWGNILLDCKRFQDAIDCFDEALMLGVSEFECNLKRYFNIKLLEFLH